jgi:hypothetical protein
VTTIREAGLRGRSVVGSLALVVALAGAPGLARPAGATMPPKTCGYIKVAKHRYLVKADQVPCTFAERWAGRYIAARAKPAGFTCTKQPATSRIRVFCRKSYHTYFAQK